MFCKYIILFNEEPGSIAPHVTLERTCVSALSLKISTSRNSPGGGDGDGGDDGGGPGSEGGGNSMGGGIGKGNGCTMTPEVTNFSVDWSIPTTEALPKSSRDIVKIEATMIDLLPVKIPLRTVVKNDHREIGLILYEFT